MTSPRTIVNSLSLSRIVLGLLFVLCFQRNTALFRLSVAFFVTAWITDLLDGYFARKLRVASTYGRHWDSLGDKSFYIATIVAFNGQGFLVPLISWGLIVREVGLYITRILFIQNLPKINQIWPLTKCHGYFMYITIIIGLFEMYFDIKGFPLSLHPYMQLSACLALACGVGSLIQFVKLR